MTADTTRAAELIRAAREDIGLAQRALAERVGVKQSNLAAIEAGRRPVSREMLVRILLAADYRPSLPLGFFRDEIKERGRRYGVTGIRVFGSVARGADHHGSDIDLLVDLEPGSAGFELGAFASEVEELTGFPVDVVVDRGDRPGLAPIRETAVPL